MKLLVFLVACGAAPAPAPAPIPIPPPAPAPPPAKPTLEADCTAMYDHVMSLFESEHVDQSPPDRQATIDGCKHRYAAQPDHPSLQCMIHADTTNEVMVCMKDAPR